MTLTGQESRILTQYYFPEHPDLALFRQLCAKYKEQSLVQKEQENTRRKAIAENMMKQKKLDEDFMEKLKSFDLDGLDDEE